MQVCGRQCGVPVPASELFLDWTEDNFTVLVRIPKWHWQYITSLDTPAIVAALFIDSWPLKSKSSSISNALPREVTVPYKYRTSSSSARSSARYRSSSQPKSTLSQCPSRGTTFTKCLHYSLTNQSNPLTSR